MAETMSVPAVSGEWVGGVVDGRFPLRQWLGDFAGMGVFLTEAGEPAQRAIIKVVPAEAERAEDRESAWPAAAALAHPNLMKVFAHGRCEIDGVPVIYVVTEFADEVLADVLRGRPLTTRETRDLLSPALGALSYLHANGFVHGRLKPSNIMAVGDQLRLSSDGIAVAASASNPVADRTVYDAPETAQGEISPAADVWSLGATLVEILTMYPPAWNRGRSSDPTVPESTPEPFASVARKCLRMDPAERPSIEEIKSRLQLGVAPALAERKPQALSRGNRRIAIILAVTALVLAAAGIWNRVSHHSQEHSAVQQAQSTPPAAQAASPSSSASNRNFAPAVGTSAASAERPAPATSAPVAEPLKESAPETPQSSAAAAPVQAATPPKKAPAGIQASEGAAQGGAALKGSAVQQVQPDIAPKALKTITGTIRITVRLEVDAYGNVTAASLESAGPSQYFANKVLDAARGWKFIPAQANGRAVPSTWILHYQLKQSGVDVASEETVP